MVMTLPRNKLVLFRKRAFDKEEAIKLLRDFIKEIHAYRYDNIRLYDLSNYVSAL